MLNSMWTKNTHCEQEAKFIQDRIASVERNLAEFCYVFGEYSRKAARIRDKGDEISRVAIAYAESEDTNKSLSDGLANFASAVTATSDYCHQRVQNIDDKVVNEFSQYENICKQVKDEVKHIFAAREKEINRKRQLDRIRERNPRNRQQIVQAETELVRATADVSRTIHNLEDQITTFERQKLHDIKGILLDFISIEMGYHAKALECLTKAFQDVQSINEEADLEDFRKSLRMPETIPHNVPKRNLLRASQSLGSINTLFSAGNRKRSPGIPPPVQGRSKQDITKSAETLDSLKHSISDTAGSDSNSEDDEDTGSEDSGKEKPSPFVARKYLK